MNIKTNTRFRRKYPILPEPNPDIPGGLRKIVFSRIVDDGGACVIEVLRRKRTNANRASCTATEWECFINHFHLDDYGKNCLLGMAIYCDTTLRETMKKMLAKDMMRSIISLDEDGGCVFRCHVIRNEDDWMRGGPEDYTDEDLLIIDPDTPI